MKDTRVVITGLGVVSSIGIGKNEFWKNLIAGKSGISRVESVDVSKYDRQLGGEVKNFDAGKWMSERSRKETGRGSQFAIAAAKMALADSKNELENLSDKKVAVIMGTTMADIRELETLNKTWVEVGAGQAKSSLIPQYPGSSLSSNVTHELLAQSVSFTIPTACAAGNYSIGYGYDLLKLGKIDLAICGGADPFSRITFTGFGRLFAMAKEKCRPFDKNRDGMLLGEGAAVLVLERLEDALERDVPIYAEVLGYGLSCDAHHMTQPSVDGIKRCMLKALKEANIKSEDVDYISAHGTGTPQNDKTECQAIKEIFSDANDRESLTLMTANKLAEISEKNISVNLRPRNRRICISSIKSMLGHTMGAASAIEAISCCLAIKDSIIPPTINFETPDPECDIDCVPNQARKAELNIVLNNSYAFGGNNACLVLKRQK